jgi:flavin reductase (DIM6/NTAB) family NADH-FMN oxidoreductase RutF
MNPEEKKITLRMIPYGLYVLTAETPDGCTAAAAINWATQASFQPPQIAVCIKVDSWTHAIIQKSGAFALNILGKGQQAMAYTFFKPAPKEGETIGGEHYHHGITGSPILDSAPAFLECRIVGQLTLGDHTIFVGEVVEAGVTELPPGRPDEATLWLKDLGEKIFYGG